MKPSQDFLLGLFFTVIGAVAALIAMRYPFGTSSRMGPGYFPTIISGLLMLTGLMVLLRSRLAQSEAVQEIRWKPLVMVPGAVVIFGFVVKAVGLPIAVLLLSVLSASTSIKFRLDWKAAAGAVAFAAFCSFVFVKVLGQPMPLLGDWLQGFGF